MVQPGLSQPLVGEQSFGQKLVRCVHWLIFTTSLLAFTVSLTLSIAVILEIKNCVGISKGINASKELALGSADLAGTRFYLDRLLVQLEAANYDLQASDSWMSAAAPTDSYMNLQLLSYELEDLAQNNPDAANYAARFEGYKMALDHIHLQPFRAGLSRFLPVPILLAMILVWIASIAGIRWTGEILFSDEAEA